MIKVSITAPAVRDFKTILSHLSSEAPELAECLYRSVLKIIDVLKDQPTAGEPGRLPETREIPVPDTSYRIVYKYSGKTLVIIALLHAFRDPMNPGSR